VKGGGEGRCEGGESGGRRTAPDEPQLIWAKKRPNWNYARGKEGQGAESAEDSYRSPSTDREGTAKICSLTEARGNSHRQGLIKKWKGFGLRPRGDGEQEVDHLYAERQLEQR